MADPSGSREWSDQQKSIFKWFKEPTSVRSLVVEACAGTGKSTTMVEAIEHAPEEKIFMGAFNKKIAVELEGKVKNRKAKVQTFHSAGFYYARRNMNNPKLDEDRGTRIAARALGVGLEHPKEAISLVARLAALGKNMVPINPTASAMTDIAYDFDMEPEEHLVEDGYTMDEVVNAAMRSMDLAASTAKRENCLDFDDMIFVPLRNNWVRPWYTLAVIDEAQDMNMSQLIEGQRLVMPGGRIVVVGDSRQAIYGFRGAASDSIQRLKRELRADELRLTTTYRCPKAVVRVAQSIVPYYQAAPSAPEGEVLDYNYEKMVEAANIGDFVLSRKNAPLAKVCMRMIRDGKKARIEGKDVGAGLLSIVKQLRAKDIEEFLGKLDIWERKCVERLQKIEKKSAQRRIEYIHDQAEVLRTFSEADDVDGPVALARKIEEMFIQTNGNKDFVLCSSVHRAKGLEADRVFVLRDTLYPGGNRDEEEQNIEYVAVTRAKRTLCWVTGIG